MKKMMMILSAFLLVLVGCGNGAESSKVLDSDITGQTVTVGVWKGNNGEEKALDNMIKAFEEKTGAKVEKRVYTDISQQLPTELIGNTAPDVFYVDALLAKSLIKDGALEPMDQYLTDDDKADFYENIIAPFSQDGEIYALPKDWSSLGVFYNEDLLAEAGFTAEDIPSKLEDFPAFISKLQEKLPEGKTAYAENDDLARVFTWLQTKDASILTKDVKSNFADPQIVKNAQILADIDGSEGAKTVKELGYDWQGDAFGAGDAAIVIEGPWLLPALANDYKDTKFGVKEMPTYNGEQNTPAFTVGWGVNSNAKNKEAAVQFATYATGKEGMKIWTEQAQVIPSRDSVAKELKIDENDILKTFANQADFATVWQLEDVTSKLVSEFNNVFPDIANGKLSIEEGFKKIDDTVNKDLEDFNE